MIIYFQLGFHGFFCTKFDDLGNLIDDFFGMLQENVTVNSILLLFDIRHMLKVKYIFK